MSQKLTKTLGILAAALSVTLAGCGNLFTTPPGVARAANGVGASARKASQGFTPAWVKDAVFYQIFPEQ